VSKSTYRFSHTFDTLSPTPIIFLDDFLADFMDDEYSPLCPESEKPDNLIDGLLDEKISLLQDIIDELGSEIRQRKALRNGALKEIEEELAKLSSLLLEVAPMGYVNVSGKYIDSLNSRRMHLEKGISGLKEQERSQKIETWRDILNLKKELFRLLPEYIELLRMRKVVD